jgi:hypothetical protein
MAWQVPLKRGGFIQEAGRDTAELSDRTDLDRFVALIPGRKKQTRASYRSRIKKSRKPPGKEQARQD